MRPAGSGGAPASAALPLLDNARRHCLRRGALHLPARRSERDPCYYSDRLLSRDLSDHSINALDQHRVAELVRPVAVRLERRARLGQRRVVRRTRAAARSGWCRARACRTESRRRRAAAGRPDALVGEPSPARTTPSRAAACSSARTTVVPMATIATAAPPASSGWLTAVAAGMRYGSSNGSRRSSSRIAGRRDAGRVRDRGERDAALAHRAIERPVEREARRRRLEGDRHAGDRRPDVPQRERRRHVRVLNRPAVAREAGPDASRRPSKRSRTSRG